MSVPSPTRLAGAALALGGVVFSASYWLKEVAGEASNGGVFSASVLTNVCGTLLVLLGLPAWYATQAHRVRVAGLVSFVVVFTALPVLEIGSSVFAAAQGGLGLPGDVEFETATGLATGLFVYGLAGTNLGLVALGVCTWLAGVLPRGAAALVTVGPLLMFAPVSFAWGEAAVLSVCFLGVAWIGAGIATGGRDHAESADRPVPAVV